MYDGGETNKHGRRNIGGEERHSIEANVEEQSKRIANLNVKIKRLMLRRRKN